MTKSETPFGDDSSPDHYDSLQISSNAEPETINRVYRLLAQRFHPDNQETGDEVRFRKIHEAYLTLSDPEQRAGYDIKYHEARRTRWRPVSTETRADNDFELEEITRLTLLELLYSHRRTAVNAPGIFILDLEELIGRAREHLEFTLWYLVQKQYIQRGDNSRYQITAEGVDYLEGNYREGYRQALLKPGDPESQPPDLEG